eukprot:1322015-Ditylum_brightwellii.AAC.1
MDPALKFYNNIPPTINTNDNLKQFRTNETLCKGCAVKLKSIARVKNIWDDRLTNTISMNEVECMICEHYDNSLPLSEKLKLFPEKDTVTIKLQLLGNVVDFEKVNITQFSIDSNIAKTDH